MAIQVSKLEERQLVALSQELREQHAALKLKLQHRDGEAGGEVHDMKDDAAAEALDEVRAAAEARDMAEMADIEQALARMHAETYGLCVDCGQPIGIARLKAYPTAKRCRNCQGRHERHAGGSHLRH